MHDVRYDDVRSVQIHGSVIADFVGLDQNVELVHFYIKLRNLWTSTFLLKLNLELTIVDSTYQCKL